MVSDVNLHPCNKTFSDWRKNMVGLLQPRYPGRLPQVRRNLFNIVLLLDATMPSALSIVETLNYYLQNQIPLRVSYVLVVPGEEERKAPQFGDLNNKVRLCRLTSG